jgi:hypothetical protein
MQPLNDHQRNQIVKWGLFIIPDTLFLLLVLIPMFR